MSIKEVLKIIGAESHSIGHAEKFISAIGGFIGIALPMWISFHYLGPQSAVLLTASMGASAVLLFAAPHSPLTQPWPMMGGHIISAVIGVTCAQWISNTLIAAPLSVALAIFAMHYLRCIHPPGGGSALAAVISGSEVHALGYQFVLTPVLLNATIMLLTAILINYIFPWRRYPAYLKKLPGKRPSSKDDVLNHDDFEYALKKIGSYIDIDEDDLAKIYKLAFKHAQHISDQPELIAEGNHYSNGLYGPQWCVRKVTTISGDGIDAVVTYKIVEGNGGGSSASCTMAEFTDWQQYEVIHDKGAWHRILRSFPVNGEVRSS